MKKLAKFLTTRPVTALALAAVFVACTAAATTFTGLVIRASENSDPTCSSLSGNGDICVGDDVQIVDDITVNDDATVTGDLAVTGTFAVTSTTAFTGGLSAPVAATNRAVIRFCGNGPDGATATYMGPVLLADSEAALAFGGAGCDGLESTTEATANEPWHAGFAYKPVAMACVGLCTGATAANDPIVFQLRDDAASVTGMTCTTAALGGDATPAQCVVRDSTPETVAAASAMAVSIVMTNDDCNDAGDDFECLVEVNF